MQGAELEYGAGLAVTAGLARPVEGRAGLVEDAEEGELGEDGDADDFRGGGGGGAGVLRDVGGDEGGPARAGVDEGELLLVGPDDAPARREHSRQSVAMAATSVREGVMKRRSSLYERWVAGRDAEWPGTVRGRVMEVLGRMALVMTRLVAW